MPEVTFCVGLRSGDTRWWPHELGSNSLEVESWFFKEVGSALRGSIYNVLEGAPVKLHWRYAPTISALALRAGQGPQGTGATHWSRHTWIFNTKLGAKGDAQLLKNHGGATRLFILYIRT